MPAATTTATAAARRSSLAKTPSTGRSPARSPVRSPARTPATSRKASPEKLSRTPATANASPLTKEERAFRSLPKNTPPASPADAKKGLARPEAGAEEGGIHLGNLSAELAILEAAPQKIRQETVVRPPVQPSKKNNTGHAAAGAKGRAATTGKTGQITSRSPPTTAAKRNTAAAAPNASGDWLMASSMESKPKPRQAQDDSAQYAAQYAAQPKREKTEPHVLVNGGAVPAAHAAAPAPPSRANRDFDTLAAYDSTPSVFIDIDGNAYHVREKFMNAEKTAEELPAPDAIDPAKVPRMEDDDDAASPKSSSTAHSSIICQQSPSRGTAAAAAAVAAAAVPEPQLLAAPATVSPAQSTETADADDAVANHRSPKVPLAAENVQGERGPLAASDDAHADDDDGDSAAVAAPMRPTSALKKPGTGSTFKSATIVDPRDGENASSPRRREDNNNNDENDRNANNSVSGGDDDSSSVRFVSMTSRGTRRTGNDDESVQFISAAGSTTLNATHRSRRSDGQPENGQQGKITQLFDVRDTTAAEARARGATSRDEVIQLMRSAKDESELIVFARALVEKEGGSAMTLAEAQKKMAEEEKDAKKKDEKKVKSRTCCVVA